MAIKPTIAAMVLRKKEIVDLTHRGLNPILAKNTQSLQRVSISMIVNLVGFQEAIFDILKQTSDIKISTDMINSLINVVNTSAKEFEENISISFIYKLMILCVLFLLMYKNLVKVLSVII